MIGLGQLFEGPDKAITACLELITKPLNPIGHWLKLSIKAVQEREAYVHAI